MLNFVGMDDEEYSGYVDDGESAADIADSYSVTERRGHSVLGRLVRHGRVWFVKSYDSGADMAEAELRIRKEYELLIRLNHPGVVRAGWVEKIPEAGFCLTMEYVEGETLDRFLHHATRAERRQISLSLLKAMAYIHSEGICHLDLKPQNIMVVGHGDAVSAKIVDFGMSVWGGNALFRPGGGTRSYGSPEQFGSDYQPSPRSDVYSLGLLLKQIDGGASIRWVARIAAVRDPDSRPADAGALLALVRKSRRRYICLIAGWATIALAVGVAVILPLTTSEREPEVVTPEAAPDDSAVSKPQGDAVVVAPEEAPGGNVESEPRPGSNIAVPEIQPVTSEPPKAPVEKKRDCKEEYDRLVDKWLVELEHRFVNMKNVAGREDLPINERRKLYKAMKDSAWKDTARFFMPFRKKLSDEDAKCLPFTFGTILEPRFEDVKERIEAISL